MDYVYLHDCVLVSSGNPIDYISVFDRFVCVYAQSSNGSIDSLSKSGFDYTCRNRRVSATTMMIQRLLKQISWRPWRRKLWCDPRLSPQGYREDVNRYSTPTGSRTSSELLLNPFLCCSKHGVYLYDLLAVCLLHGSHLT